MGGSGKLRLNKTGTDGKTVMGDKLANQTIWITGASSGVGEGMAYVFHAEGANLILSGRRVAELERVKRGCQ